jgi:uncharacterized protein
VTPGQQFDPVAAADAAVETVYREVAASLLPTGQRVWDVHTHLGDDSDGSTLRPAQLVSELEEHAVARAFAFPFRAATPDGYPRLNEQVIAWCQETAGVLVPFCRVEPAPGARTVLERALDRGARGIKLHPSAGHFAHDDPIVEAALALAEERSVPVLLHAGRGLPPVGAHLASLVARYPGAQVILAHACVADMPPLAGSAAGLPNVTFDCAVWNMLDVWALLGRAAPEQIVFGTDAPYYRSACMQVKLLLALRAAGAGEAALGAAMWGNAERVAAGVSAADLSAPIGAGGPGVSVERLRAHEYLLVSLPLVWMNQPDVLGAIRLARNALTHEQDGGPARAAQLLALAEECWSHELVSGDRSEILSLSWLTFRLLELADALILCG